MNIQEENNPLLMEVPMPDTELKRWLVEYVGNSLGPKDGNVTVEMIVNVMAEEFPEFLLVVAEENFFRGYEQALTDLNIEDEQDT
jgi:hypothetical protein